MTLTEEQKAAIRFAIKALDADNFATRDYATGSCDICDAPAGRTCKKSCPQYKLDTSLAVLRSMLK